ncbi:putative hypothetical protein [Streptomyces sp. NBRC 110611]|uniref:hypothetical protein n=1 Tax=Streptomyces sp. NBRC 110611 TaxID=1621259 RepID=UPI000855DA1F|nr:hypothetical protein [Streptomyces sp. NBRC 110611]GAU67395.1 putative hypothetical protein [Streptomyces sp. NBRC 110611]
MQRKLVLTLGAASLGAVTLLGMGTATAGAAPAKESAPATASAGIGLNAGKFYVFKDDNFKNGYYPFAKSDGNFANNKWIGGAHNGRTINNGTSSMRNTTDRWIDLYADADDGHGCGGARYSARPHSEDSDLTNNRFDNKASCVRFR